MGWVGRNDNNSSLASLRPITLSTLKFFSMTEHLRVILPLL